MAETRAQRARRLAQERLKAERQVEAELRREFSRVTRQYQREIRAAGQEGQALLEDHRDRLRLLLTAHYDRIRRRFKGTVLEDLRVTPASMQSFNDLIDTAFDQWKRRTSFTVSGQIVITTRRNLVTAKELARAAREIGLPPMTNAELASTSGTILGRILGNRASTISVSETTNAAETAKLAEAQAANGEVPTIARGLGLQPTEPPAPGTIEKQWDTMIDGRERPAHNAANGQRVPLNTPFTVGGEQLSYPRDTSLGASASNVINCRCSTRYVRVT